MGAWREVFLVEKTLRTYSEAEVSDAFCAGLTYGAAVGAMLLSLVVWLW